MEDPIRGQRDVIERLVLFEMKPSVRCGICTATWTFARSADATRFSHVHKERHRCLLGGVHPLTRAWHRTHPDFCTCPATWMSEP